MPRHLNAVTGQLGKDLFHPTFTTENPVFTSDHDRMGTGIFRQQLGGYVVVSIDVSTQIFAQRIGNAYRNIKIYTFQQYVTSVVGVVAARRHVKTPNW